MASEILLLLSLRSFIGRRRSWNAFAISLTAAELPLIEFHWKEWDPIKRAVASCTMRLDFNVAQRNWSRNRWKKNFNFAGRLIESRLMMIGLECSKRIPGLSRQISLIRRSVCLSKSLRIWVSVVKCHWTLNHDFVSLCAHETALQTVNVSQK